MRKIRDIGASLLWNIGMGPLARALREPRELALAYHAIGKVEGSFAHVTISFEALKEHISYLRNRGYVFRQFRDAPVSGGKNAYIYFDDGFRSVREVVYPYFKNERIPATLFITTDFINQKKAQEVYLTWDEVRGMIDVFEIGSHGARHVKLNKIDVGEAEADMKHSREEIESYMGAPVRSFSYPKGRSSPELERAAARAGYQITTAHPQFHKIRPDPDDTMSIFLWKIILP